MNKVLANPERLTAWQSPAFSSASKTSAREARQDGRLAPEGHPSLGAGSAQEPTGWWEGFASPKARYQKDLRVERGCPNHHGVRKIPQKSRTGSWLSIMKMVTQGFEKKESRRRLCSNLEAD